ncbi:MAG: pitrilysin family protein [Myxococcota bacterium]
MLLLLTIMTQRATALEIPHETYTLDNGLTVILHEDHSLPQVVINMWVDVGSKDEVVGRTGFAHLFEHLMFMGTDRLPGAGFDELMERHGGWNNAWTSEDATDYYSVGPNNLAETFLWMEADRLDGLARAMNQEKLDKQREVVRNERRQGSEDTPYGEAWLRLPEVMYPPEHPYGHPVIGSHEDLQAATVQDVTRFFNTWYVPENVSLVVAGDFDPETIKPAIRQYFGSLRAVDVADRAAIAPLTHPQQKLLELTDQVQVPMSILSWHAPATFQPGDATLDLLAAVLGDGRASRLYDRLIHREGAALEADVYQISQRLGSLFTVVLKPSPDHSLEDLEAAVYDELAQLAADGPTQEELQRVRNQLEVAFIQGMESLQRRASRLNHYQTLLGTPDGLQRDLDRYRGVTAKDIQEMAATLVEDRVGIIRVYPEEGEE